MKILRNILNSPVTSVVGVIAGSPALAMVYKAMAEHSSIDMNSFIPSVGVLVLGLLSNEHGQK